jgi:hypothetical protein
MAGLICLLSAVLAWIEAFSHCRNADSFGVISAVVPARPVEAASAGSAIGEQDHQP